MMSMRNRKPDEEDDLAGLVDAKMGAAPMKVSSQPSTPSLKPSTPVAPRQNFGGPTPASPTTQRPPAQTPRVPPREGVTYAPPPLPAQTTVTTAPGAAVTRGMNNADRYLPPGVDDGDGADPEDSGDAALDALAAKLDSAAAQNQAGAAAKAGLGGFGLSGGSAAMASDIGSADARERVLALQDLANAQKDQDFQDIQRTAAIDDLEEEQDRDLDGDGDVAGKSLRGKGVTLFGDGDPSNNKGASPADVANQEEAQRIADLSQKDFEKETKESLESAGWSSDGTQYDDNGRPYFLWVSPSGEKRRAYQDDAGEQFSNGLEWA